MKLPFTSDQILTAYADSGPGWADGPNLIWVIYRKKNGQLDQYCIQSEDHTVMMRTLFTVSEAAHLSMTNAIRKVSQ